MSIISGKMTFKRKFRTLRGGENGHPCAREEADYDGQLKTIPDVWTHTIFCHKASR